MKYFSTFSGVGGFELGITQAYESNNEHAHISEESESEECAQRGFRSIDKHGIQLHDRNRATPLCVGYSEIDKYATQIYQQHFPNHKNYGDITTIDPKELPDFDLFVGGFPCQAFSIAGKRGGFNDTRGTMFFEIARIVREKQPRLLLLENVKGLLSHDQGKTFNTIITTLDELGYDLQWQVLNSKNHGVPQNRERVFIIGHLRGTSRPEVFPFTGSSSTDIEQINQPTHSNDRVYGTYVGKRSPHQIIGGSQGNRVYDPTGISTTIASQAGGLGAKTGLYMVDDPSRKKGVVDKNIAPTLRTETHGNLPGVVDGIKIRRLTPTECERLQGFPDGWTEALSDTQRYKTLGNAVTVNVVRDIMKKMLQ